MTHNEMLAYLAGIIDGEGCIGAWRRRAKSDRPRAHAEVSIRVSMTTPHAVKRLHAAFGGALFAERHPGGNRRQTFAWVVTAAKAEAALRALLPYLCEKREQAEVALALREIGRRPGAGKGHTIPPDQLEEREAHVQKLKALKRVEYDPSSIH